MRSAMKKLCSVLLALIMILALLPAAFADTDEPVQEAAAAAAEESELPEDALTEPEEEPAAPFDEPEDEPEEEPEEELLDEPEDEPEEELLDEPEDEPEEEPLDEPEDEPEDRPEKEPVIERGELPEEGLLDTQLPETSLEMQPIETAPQFESKGDLPSYVLNPDDWAATVLSVGTASAYVPAGGYQMFVFTPSQTANYRFYSVTGAYYYDTYCVLFDGDHNRLLYDDDGADNGQFLIVERLEAGQTYYFCVSLYSTNTSGSFNVVLQQLKTGWNYIDEDWYYILEDGSFAKGLQTIKGKLYYFDDGGRMSSDVAFMWNGAAYYAEPDGTVTAVAEDGWFSGGEDGTDWYYVQDGAFLTGHQKIDGKWYFFSLYNYRMVKNAEAYQYDQETGNDLYYRAKPNGELIVNAWFQDTFGTWFYYGAEGVAARGFRTLGGKEYYFEYDGEMSVNTLFEENGTYRYAGDNGVVKTFKEGWNRIYTTYFYLKNGELLKDCVEQIGNFSYGFDWMGHMYDNEAFWLNDSYYRAREGGALYTGVWFESSYDTLFYYNSDSTAATGLVTIDGKMYMFNSWGSLLTNRPVWMEETLFFADGDGVLTPAVNGWTYVGGSWYYVQADKLYTDTVVMIGGSYYGFDDDGRMYCGEMFEHNGDFYRAAPNGKLLVSVWFEEEYEEKGEFITARYYYGPYAAAYHNSQPYLINGNLYMFWYDGEVRTNTSVTYEGKLYACGADGVLKELKNGWNQIGGNWYYVKDGALAKNTALWIKGKLYGFNYEGRMITNDLVWFDGHTGRAKENGEMYTNFWFQTNNGDWYYYDENGIAPEGFATVNGKRYYFEYDGRMASNKVIQSGDKFYLANANGIVSEAKNNAWNKVGRYYYIENGVLLKSCVHRIGNKYYGFDYYGRMYADQVFYMGGNYYRAQANGALYANIWYQEPLGDWYYYDANGVAARDFTTIGGKLYYFDWYGKMAANQVVEDDNNTYIAASSGVLTKAKEGWNQIDHAWYYIYNGNLLTGRRFINGTAYYFDWNGILQRDTTMGGRVYNSEGKQVKSGWYEMAGVWYYVDPITGNYVTGSKQIGSSWYYFTEDGVMMTGEVFHSGKKFVYAAGGAKQSEAKVNQNGWTLIDGVYYYYKNGKPHTGWVGSYYINNGVMIVDSIVSGSYVGSDGKMVKSAFINDRYYAKDNGLLARNEWLYLNNAAWYYFHGFEMVRGIWIIDGKVYQFGSLGAYEGKLADSVKNGWVTLKRNYGYAYIYQGELIKDMTIYINSTLYAFNRYGWMVRGDFYWDDYSDNLYFFGSDGKMAKYTGWRKLGNYWYYFNSDYSVRIGDFVLGGKTYSCYAIMETGWNVTETDAYHYSGSGALDETVHAPDGWFKKDGVSYYFRDGKRLSNGFYKIGGKTYGFDWDGSLVINMPLCRFGYQRKTTTFEEDGWYEETEWVDALYFCGKDGTIMKSKGWKTGADGNKYYTDITGRCYTGTRIIDGKTYLFNKYGQLIG